MSTPARSVSARSSASRVLAGLAQAMPELGVARVDRELLAGLGVLDDDHAGVGKLVLARIEQPDRDDLVALGQLQQRALPAGRGDEVGDEDDERAPPDRAERELEQARQVGDRAARAGGGRIRLRASASTWLRPLRGGSVLLDLVVEEDRADAVAAAGEQAGERRRELAQHELLRPVDRAEPHRRRPVEQEPRGQLAILDVLPHERRVHPRRDVPVDVADVVARLVLAQVEEVRPDPAEDRAVVPLQQAVEAADHLPLEAVEELAQASRRRGCGRCPCVARTVAPPCAMRSLSASSGSGTAARMRSMIVVRRDAVGERLVGEHEPVAQDVGGDLAGGPGAARTRGRGRARAPGRRGSC